MSNFETLGQVSPGLGGTAPAFFVASTADNFATITATGYLNDRSKLFKQNDVIWINYSDTSTWPLGEASTLGFFTVSVSGSNYSLTVNNPEGFLLAANNLSDVASVSTSRNNLGLGTAQSVVFGNVQAGASGSAGSFVSYPATATSGSLALAGVANAGNYANVISNASTGQATTWSLPDPGSATANILINKGSQTMAAGGFLGLDKGTGSVVSDAVTINAQAGVITTGSLTTAAGADDTAITLTNSKITSSSVITCTVMGGTNTTNGVTIKAVPGNGSATITLTNGNVANAALNGTVIFGFVVS